MINVDNKIFRRHPEIGIFGVFMILVIVFSVGSENFRSLDMATSILTVAANVGIIALGCAFLMIAGEFDISVGAVYLFSTLIFVSLANAGIEPAIAFFLSLLICALIGSINGILVVYLNIHSFIVTIGALMFYRGLHVVLTRGFSVSYKADKEFLQIIGGNPFSMFRNTIIWWFLIGIILHIILTRTKYGNWVFATGGNLESARNIGVKTNRVKIINFSICSLLAGLAGTTNIARFYVSQSQLGLGMEFEAITAAVLGGCILTGGRGSILGAMIGATFMATIRSGLVTMGYSSYIYMPITGMILVFAVVINKYITGEGILGQGYGGSNKIT